MSDFEPIDSNHLDDITGGRNLAGAWNMAKKAGSKAAEWANHAVTATGIADLGGRAYGWASEKLGRGNAPQASTPQQPVLPAEQPSTFNGAP